MPKTKTNTRAKSTKKQTKRSNKLNAGDIRENIQFMDDMYSQKNIIDCVEELKDKFTPKFKDSKLKKQHVMRDEEEQNKVNMEEALFWLNQGHNICFYGFGNKENVIQKFVKTNFSNDCIVLTIRGYSRNMTPKALLMQIIQALDVDDIELVPSPDPENEDLNEDKMFKIMEKLKSRKKLQLKDIIDSLSELILIISDPILIVIHNIDNQSLRLDNFLEQFSSLVNTESNNNDPLSLRFIATVDSVKFHQSLSRTVTKNFGFLFFLLETKEFFDKQFNYITVVDTVQSNKKYLQNMQGVIDSLTDSQKELVFFTMFVFLNQKNKVISENALFKKAVEEAKVSSIHQFKDNLREAIQHNIFANKYISGFLCYTTKLNDIDIRKIFEIYDVKEFDEDSDDDFYDKD